MIRNFEKNLNSVYGQTARNKLVKYCEENPIDEIKLASMLHITYPDLLNFKNGSDNLTNQQITHIQQFLERRHY